MAQAALGWLGLAPLWLEQYRFATGTMWWVLALLVAVVLGYARRMRRQDVVSPRWRNYLFQAG